MYLSGNIFKVIDFVSISTSLQLIVLAFRIEFNDIHKDFELPNKDKTFLYEMSKLEDMTKDYRFLAGINSLLIFLRLLQYFEFDERLKRISLILKNAKIDMYYFSLMFIIFWLSYSLIGYMLFGDSDVSFQNFWKAVISLLIMI